MKKILSLLLFVPFLVFGQYKLTSEGNYLNIEDQYTGINYSHPSVDLYYQIFGDEITFRSLNGSIVWSGDTSLIVDPNDNAFSDLRYWLHLYTGPVRDDIPAGVIQAVKNIYSIYGHKVSVQDKAKDLVKFGINNDVSNSRETVWWTGGNETYATGNTIDSISSTDNSDMQIVGIEGHTISGTIRSFVSFDDTLNGQTPKVLNIPLYRLTRMFNKGSTDFAGVIYGYSGGAVSGGQPSVADSIHITIPVGWNQSVKASTSLSSTDYWIVTSVEAEVGVSSGNARTVDFDLEVRNPGGVFRRVRQYSSSNTSPATIVYLDPPLIIIPGSDIRMTAISSNTGTQVKATIGGYLAKIKN